MNRCKNLLSRIQTFSRKMTKRGIHIHVFISLRWQTQLRQLTLVLEFYEQCEYNPKTNKNE